MRGRLDEERGLWRECFRALVGRGKKVAWTKQFFGEGEFFQRAEAFLFLLKKEMD